MRRLSVGHSGGRDSLRGQEGARDRRRAEGRNWGFHELYQQVGSGQGQKELEMWKVMERRCYLQFDFSSRGEGREQDSDNLKAFSLQEP